MEEYHAADFETGSLIFFCECVFCFCLVERKIRRFLRGDSAAREFVSRRLTDVESTRSFIVEMRKKYSRSFAGPLILFALRELIKRGEFATTTTADMQRYQVVDFYFDLLYSILFYYILLYSVRFNLHISIYLSQLNSIYCFQSMFYVMLLCFLFLQRLLCTHAARAESGVMVIAVFTSPVALIGCLIGWLFVV